jgi:hypothetical protein
MKARIQQIGIGFEPAIDASVDSARRRFIAS